MPPRTTTRPHPPRPAQDRPAPALLATARAAAVRTAATRPAAVLLAGYLAELLFRLVLVRSMSFPSVHPDEDSYLALARVLAGGSATEIPVGVVVPGGYPLLISPALRLADDPATAYHLVMGVNAAVNALVFPLAYVALRRLGLNRRRSYAFGAATALLPPVVFYSQFVMTDAVLPVLVLAWLLCLHGWLADGPLRRRTWHAVGAGASAGCAMAVHDRGGVVVALTAAVLLGVLLLRRAPWRATAPGLAALGLGVLGAELLSAWLHAQFTVPDSDVGGSLWKGLTDPAITLQTLARAAGQVWYFIASTWGIGGLAVVACLGAVFDRRPPRALRITGGVLVALLFGTALAASAALPLDGRVDDWVYARYTSYLVPAAFVAGVAVLAGYGRRALVRTAAVAAGLVLLLAGVVALEAGERLHTSMFIPWTLPDVSFLAADWGRIDLPRTCAAVVFALGTAVLVRNSGGAGCSGRSAYRWRCSPPSRPRRSPRRSPGRTRWGARAWRPASPAPPGSPRTTTWCSPGMSTGRCAPPRPSRSTAVGSGSVTPAGSPSRRRRTSWSSRCPGRGGRRRPTGLGTPPTGTSSGSTPGRTGPSGTGVERAPDARERAGTDDPTPDRRRAHPGR